MVHQRGNRFYIAVLDLQTRQFRVLTSGGLDESPSFAPNGKTIIYSNGRGVATVSVDGGSRRSPCGATRAMPLGRLMADNFAVC